MSALLDASPKPGASDAWFALAQALTVLAAAAALVWLLWRVRQQTLSTKAQKHLRIEARVPLDLKNTLWIVDVEGRRLLIGTADSAPPRLLTELSKEDRPNEVRP
jgi:flagellar biogenesis protein FliO